ncbi:hypothetical protein TD95_001342 [Thielaviopsis punctulata]|uniref:Cupin 2 conserved barrel domain-containing protein n=1 Tax=Thielaviopsis punctulata TaxID=72032 RepID=A0A0F4ZM98_9PEZI|nr:hypothetical protein TD95_001342 [Thielaviopsis punctulata]
MFHESPENTVQSWGYSIVFTSSDKPNAHYPPHSHVTQTTHLILEGSMTLRYPDQPEPNKFTYSAGDRVDVAAGQEHEVWMGETGCKYVVGEKIHI